MELGETIVSNISSNLGKVVTEAYLYKKQTGAEFWLGVGRELGWGDAGTGLSRALCPLTSGLFESSFEKHLRGNAGRVQIPGGWKQPNNSIYLFFFPPSPTN